jgi:hypothetical protein
MATTVTISHDLDLHDLIRQAMLTALNEIEPPSKFGHKNLESNWNERFNAVLDNFYRRAVER